MPPIHLRLISSIINLRNEEFMHLFLQMILLVKKYVPLTNNEYLQHAYEDMQDSGERVKQLEVKLNAASEAIKKRNKVHKEIKDSVRYIKLKLESDLLSPSESDREKANYITSRLAGLFDQKRITSVAETPHSIETIKYTIEEDSNLARALMDLGIMTRVEILYKQAEEFRQVQLKRHTDKVTSRLINKAEIRKEATERLRYLFKVIELYHSLTGDEVWMEMAEKVRELVTEATSE